MPSPYGSVFDALKPILAAHAPDLKAKADTAVEYTLVGRAPSPHPQHKGQPMWFGSIRAGKAYASFHLMPLYMNPKLAASIPARLKPRMQGKTCFNFKTVPSPDLVGDLAALTRACFDAWKSQGLI